MQRFVIDINVGGQQAPNNRPQNREKPKLSYNPKQDKKFIEKFSYLDEVRDGKFLDLNTTQFKKKGLFRDVYNVKGVLETPDGGLEDISEDLSIGSENLKYIKAASAAAAWKATSVAVSMTQMRSGDSYYNDKLNNEVKFAGYGAALAASGPMAPLMLVGIVANEAVSAFTERQKYNYNRELEQNQVANMKALAGDVSYGRRGGKL